MILTKKIAIASIRQCLLIEEDSVIHNIPVIKSDSFEAKALINADHNLKVIFCIFSGGDKTKEFVYDFKYHKDVIGYFDEKPVKVHCLLSEIEYSIHEEVRESLMSEMLMKYPDYEVYVVGYSLGKSIAEIFSYRFDGEINAILSFGGTHTGGAQFKRALENKVPHNFRFYNNADTIPNLLKDKFNYVQTGIPVELHDIENDVAVPRCICDAMFNHDLCRNYLSPIKSLPEELEQEIAY